MTWLWFTPLLALVVTWVLGRYNARAIERDVFFELGNVADGFAQADLVREGSYNCAEVCQNQM